MGNLMCCFRPSDGKRGGTSVKTLLRRTEKPSKKRKRIDDLAADAIKREERNERQKKKREKRQQGSSNHDLKKEIVIADNVSISQETQTYEHVEERGTDQNIVPYSPKSGDNHEKDGVKENEISSSSDPNDNKSQLSQTKEGHTHPVIDAVDEKACPATYEVPKYIQADIPSDGKPAKNTDDDAKTEEETDLSQTVCSEYPESPHEVGDDQGEDSSKTKDVEKCDYAIDNDNDTNTKTIDVKNVTEMENKGPDLDKTGETVGIDCIDSRRVTDENTERAALSAVETSGESNDVSNTEMDDTKISANVDYADSRRESGENQESSVVNTIDSVQEKDDKQCMNILVREEHNKDIPGIDKHTYSEYQETETDENIDVNTGAEFEESIGSIKCDEDKRNEEYKANSADEDKRNEEYKANSADNKEYLNTPKDPDNDNNTQHCEAKHEDQDSHIVNDGEDITVCNGNSNDLSTECDRIGESQNDSLKDGSNEANNCTDSFPDVSEKNGDKTSKLLNNSINPQPAKLEITADQTQHDSPVTVKNDKPPDKGTHAGNRVKPGHTYLDKLRQKNRKLQPVQIPRLKPMSLTECFALVTGLATELKKAEDSQDIKKPTKPTLPKSGLCLDTTHIVTAPRTITNNPNRIRLLGTRKMPQPRPPGTLDFMVRSGQIPKLKEIERVKKENLEGLKRRKLTEEDRHGCLKKLKWSRHMRAAIHKEIDRAVRENEMLAALVNGRKTTLPTLTKPTLHDTAVSRPGSSRLKPETIQAIRERHCPAPAQSRSGRCNTNIPYRSTSDTRYTPISRQTKIQNRYTQADSSIESKKKAALRSMIRQFEKASKEKEKIKSRGTDREATPTRNNTTSVGIGRKDSYMTLGEENSKKEF